MSQISGLLDARSSIAGGLDRDRRMDVTAQVGASRVRNNCRRDRTSSVAATLHLIGFTLRALRVEAASLGAYRAAIQEHVPLLASERSRSRRVFSAPRVEIDYCLIGDVESTKGCASQAL
jgi:hypothetical protein